MRSYLSALVITMLAGASFAGGPSCGDGLVNTVDETCDPPGQPAGAPNTCREDCTFCGDGVLDPGLEGCDDGNNVDDDGCQAQCKLPVWVAKNGDDTTGDGSPGNPFLTIGHALDQAPDHASVIVRAGTYNECVASTGRSISIVADDWRQQQDRTSTVIDGDGICDPTQLFSQQSATVKVGGAGSGVEGFTIAGGAGSGVHGRGSVRITNNLITGNTAVWGGGIYVYTAVVDYGDVEAVITNNTISDNLARFGVPPQTGYGYSLGGDGGGIFAYAVGLSSGDARITIDGNTISANRVNETSPDDAVVVHGAGLAVSTNSSPSGLAEVTITNNNITGNTTIAGANAYSGGAWLYTYGYGQETIRMTGNLVANNAANRDGGGISAWITTYGTISDPDPGTADSNTRHTIDLIDNSVIGNSSGGNGGGLDLFLFARDLKAAESASMTARGNNVVDNEANGDFGGGGGILASFVSWRSQVGTQRMTVQENNVVSNRSAISGGGIGVVFEADANPPGDTRNPLPPPSHAEADVILRGNLVASNQTTVGGGVGAGVFAFLQSFEDANANLLIERETIADNQTSAGSGGVQLESFVDFDTPSGSAAFANVEIRDSIVAGNGGIGIGGPIPGQEGGVLAPATGNGNLAVNLAYSDVYGHPEGEFSTSWIADPIGSSGNISEDPMLADLTFVPQECSPTIDGADPVLAFSLEPSPSGGRANMGHTGNTSKATTSFPDLSGDGFIDGLDIVMLSVAFGSTTAQPRYDLLADIDGNGIVDGLDLARIAVGFGTSCRPGSP